MSLRLVIFVFSDALGLQRCGKSCRLRWINYLRPDIRRGRFTPEEEKLIISLHGAVGNRFEAIFLSLFNLVFQSPFFQMDPLSHLRQFLCFGGQWYWEETEWSFIDWFLVGLIWGEWRHGLMRWGDWLGEGPELVILKESQLVLGWTRNLTPVNKHTLRRSHSFVCNNETLPFLDDQQYRMVRN